MDGHIDVQGVMNIKVLMISITTIPNHHSTLHIPVKLAERTMRSISLTTIGKVLTLSFKGWDMTLKEVSQNNLMRE